MVRGAWDNVIPPILCYHKIDPRFELGFTRLGPRVFRRQIETLAKAGYATLGSADLLAPPPHPAPRTVVLSFDDAYSGLAEHAFPVLADHGFKALIFAITDFVGRENSWDVQYGWRKFFHLDWDALGRWRERGMEVHSHGVSHARLTWLGDAAAADELGRSRAVIAERLGAPPAAISYPFGACDARVRRLAVEAGYTLGFAGPAHAGSRDPMLLAREPVYAWEPAGMPMVLRDDGLGELARGVARVTNRCSVGTAVFQRVLGRRYGGSGFSG